MLIVPPSGGEDFDRTFVQHPGGLITFQEPLTNQPLDPTAVPDVLRTWPILQGGYDFLEEAGGQIDFSLLLSRHGDSGDLAHCEVDLRSEAQRLRAARGLLLLEGIHLVAQAGTQTRTYNDVAQGAISAETAANTLGAGGYRRDVLAAIHDTKARVEFPDMQIEHTLEGADLLSPIHRLLADWDGADEAAAKLPGTPENILRSFALNTGYQLFREFFIIGVAGAMMSRLRNLGPDATYAGSLLIGRVHRTIAAKVDALTGNTTRIVGNLESLSEIDRITMHCIGNAAISLDDTIRLFTVIGQLGEPQTDARLPAAAPASTTSTSGAATGKAATA